MSTMLLDASRFSNDAFSRLFDAPLIDTPLFELRLFDIQDGLPFELIPIQRLIINGTSGDDVLHGSNLDDEIRGFGGDDILNGNFGNDLLIGGDGDDFFRGGNGNDTLHGGDDNDTFYGGAGNDSLYGEAGNDTFFVDDPTGNDQYFGGNDDDTFIVQSGGAHSFSGGSGTDRLVIDIGNRNLAGSTFNGVEILDLGGFQGTVFDPAALAGFTQILNVGGLVHAQGGTTDFTGRATDGLNRAFFTGSDQDDSFRYLDTAIDWIADLGDGHDTIWLGSGDDEINGGAGNDTLNGRDGDDRLRGGLGNDTLNGGRGNDRLERHELLGRDVMNGGSGDDFIWLRVVGDVRVDGGTGTDTLLVSHGPADLSTATLSNLEILDLNFLSGSEAVTFQPGQLDDFLEINRLGTIRHSEGGTSDLSGVSIRGGGEFIGSNGNDTITLNAMRWTVNLQGGNDVLHGSDSTEVAHGGDGRDTLNGNGGADELWGDADGDTLNGGDGNDVLRGGSGVDILNGGKDNDILHYTVAGEADILNGGDDQDQFLVGATGPVTLNGGSGTDTVVLTADNVDLSAATLISIESLNLNGRTGVGFSAGSLDGLQSLSGTGQLVQTNGGVTDMSRVGLVSGSARYGFIGSESDDIVKLADHRLGWSVELGNGNDRVIGTRGADILNGNGGTDVLRGGLGHDTFIGSIGDDRYFGEDGNDLFTGIATGRAYGGSGADQFDISLSSGAIFDGGEDNDTFTVNGSSSLTTGRVIGRIGTDTLRVEGDADLRGFVFKGVEILDAGEFDLVIRPDAFRGFTSLTNIGTLTHFEGGRSNLAGKIASGDAGHFVGSSAKDVVSIAGADTGWQMDGLGGNDVLTGGNGIDVMTGGQGNDKLNGNAGADQLDGGDGFDTLNGGSGDDALTGGRGGDLLLGSTGHDSLHGQQGNDTLTGGGGRDTFVYSSGQDVITDFKPGTDLLDLNPVGLDNFADVLTVASQVGSDVVITLSVGNTLTLKNTLLATLSAADIVPASAEHAAPSTSNPDLTDLSVDTDEVLSVLNPDPLARILDAEPVLNTVVQSVPEPALIDPDTLAGHADMAAPLLPTWTEEGFAA